MIKIRSIVLAIGIALLTSLTMSADPTDVVIKITKRKNNGPIGNGGVGHAPMHLPIEVTFDDATGVLTVQAPEDMEGVVYVYNVNGTLEASSDHLNATFTLTSPGLHIVSIQGEDWIGEGRFIL